jgi:hypothetical protein
MKDKYKAVDPFYSLGEKLCALGEALKDNRTRMDEIAELALDAGLQMRFGIVPAEQTDSGA